MKKINLFFYALAILVNIVSCHSEKQNPEITAEELYKHIEFLASDSLKGRYPGTAEDKVAATYIAQEFKKAGLQTLFNEGLQEFEIQSKIKLGENNWLKVNDEIFVVGEDFAPISFSASQQLNSGVVFAGYGFDIKQNNKEWNDYQNIDVSGKWAIILRGEPEIENGGINFSEYNSLRSKAILAKDKGAAGVIFVSGKYFDESDALSSLDNPEGKINIPVIQVKRNIADKLFMQINKTIESIENQVKESKKALNFVIPATIDCQTDIVSESNQTYNVVSQLLINPDFEYIVIGAHYDHLGFGGAGTGSRNPNTYAIHYGADDNASGTSALIEIAEKLNSKHDSLKNNFLFVAFGAEEMGLIGSKHFVNNLPVNDTLIKAMINVDMVGRMRSERNLQIGGIGTSAEGKALIESINQKYKLKLGLSPEGYGPSDHSSFYAKNIPVFFFSTGAHIDYHTPGDSLGSINIAGMEEASRFVYDLAYMLATNSQELTYQDAGPKIPSGDYNRRKYKVTLGIMPDFSGVEKRGLRADIVISDKPAFKAGMQSGDIIIAIDGKTVADVYEYMERLSHLKAGQIITVEVLRNSEKHVLIVQL
ncbi:MAG TPA: M20/M25/M40 family metallo-hydrolase [Bacteroidales bacterium]|nr:M20/M25/M40 family metallo-hydrolase [Bacteroidales bacterium]